MKAQAFNPYLPSYEYVPDGEPYIFDDRIYVYGSHDAFNGRMFCVNDYVCYSAAINDLGNWRYEGVIYKSSQDPVNKKGKDHMNAPDVCVGPDGRYYLYYQLQMQNTTGVAVSDSPAGPFEYYGTVHHKDGRKYGLKKDAYNFDPSVFMDDDGRIYMYTGFSPDSGILRFVMGLRGGTYNGGTVIELDKDMVTVIGPEYPTIPGKLFADGTEFADHPFFEASSMRKINGTYYLVYSSVLSHELCYAYSSSPIGPWKYGGIVVSIGDIGLNGIEKGFARNFLGNTHGGMVCINDQWYIFYHRQTNQQQCARQGCADKIYIDDAGKIHQAEITSCGLNNGPLSGIGQYEARIACNLWGKRGVYQYNSPHDPRDGYPFFTQTGEDRLDNPDQYISSMSDGSVAGFKYFDFDTCSPSTITVSIKGAATGTLQVYKKLDPFSNGLAEDLLAEIDVPSTANWTNISSTISCQGESALYFKYTGAGKIDFRSFTLE